MAGTKDIPFPPICYNCKNPILLAKVRSYETQYYEYSKQDGWVAIEDVGGKVAGEEHSVHCYNCGKEYVTDAEFIIMP